MYTFELHQVYIYAFATKHCFVHTFIKYAFKIGLSKLI